MVPGFELLDERFRRVEEDAVEKAVGPQNLHLHDEMASGGVHAAHVHDRVFHHRDLWDELGREVFQRDDLPVGRQREHGVEKAAQQVRALAEHLLEGQVVFGVEVAHGGNCGGGILPEGSGK